MQTLKIFPEVTRSILLLESLQFARAHFQAVCNTLQIMAKQLSVLIEDENRKTAFETARQYRTVILTFRLGVLLRPYWECFTLCGTLLNKGGSCLGLTVLHLALGEMIGLPMKTALFEGHITPVYMEGDVPIFIETTRRSSTMYGHSMKTLYGEPIKILTNEEFLALYISNRAFAVYERAGLIDDAIFLLDSALEIFPAYTAGWINRGIIMKKIGKIAEMKRSLERARALNPGPLYSQAIKKIENEKN